MASSFFLVLFVIITTTTWGLYENSATLEPEFYAPLENITATQGRDVQFTCVVNHLAEYRVAWIKSDSKAILAIHNRLVAHNPRLSVTHNGHNTWKLHISNIQKNDSGSYMCQVNTDPMTWQLGYLNVTVPPDILNDEDGLSDGYQTLEGGSIHLRCRTVGEPLPEVSWKREDGKPIVLRKDKQIELYDSFIGENLTLSKVNRSDMGVYLCIAKSPVPPIMSKRYTVRVNFKPQVQVQNHYVGAPLSRDVKLHCKIEASPKTTFQWLNSRNEPIMPNPKIHITETVLNEFTTEMDLIIRDLDRKDFGEYSCVSENTVGRAEGRIRLSELFFLETSTRPYHEYPPEINGIPKSHKHNNHYVKVTRSPLYYPYKTSKTYSNVNVRNDVIQEVHNTSVVPAPKNRNHNHHSITVVKNVFRPEQKFLNGVATKSSTIYKLIFVFYVLTMVALLL